MSSNSILRARFASAGRKASQGFTLIELMIVVLVGLVLLMLALPSFDAVMNSGRVNGPANELVATLQLARMEAIRRNARVVVCPSANGTSCLGGNPSQWAGWIAFVDDGGFSHSWAAGNVANANNGVIDANETVLRTGSMAAPAVLQTSSNISGNTGGEIVFRSDGLARSSNGALLDGILSVCVATTHPPENTRNVSIASGSRFAVARTGNGGNCAVPPNS